MSEKEWFQKDFHNLTLVNQAVDRRQSKIALSVDRAVDRHAQSAFVHFGRPGGWSTARALLSVGSGRSPRSTDREFSSLVGNNGRPTDRPLSPTFRNSTVGGRPADQQTEEFSSEFFPTAIFCFDFFLGLFPTTLLFSTPINSGTMRQLNNFSQY